MFDFTASKHYINKVFASTGTKSIVIKAIQFALGLHLVEFDDAKAIKDLKRLESICISYNILPNGFAQDQSVTPTKWTRIESRIYFSLMTVNIVHLISLCIFDLQQDSSMILGDFFYGHPSRRYFWLYWTILSIFGEVLRHYWIHKYRTGGPFSFHMHNNVFDKGFKPEALFMSQFYCHKYRLLVSNLSNFWIRFIGVSCIGIGPVLIVIVQSVSRLPKTPQQFIFTYFWLLIHYFGIVCTLSNLILTGAIITIDLSYFYFRAVHVAQVLQCFVDKVFSEMNDYLSFYETTTREIILLLNETEYRNLKIRNWLIFLYLGISFTADFGFYSAAFVHIDHGSLDFSIIFLSAICILAIGACGYVNGFLLTKMHSCGKNSMKVARYLPPDVKSLVKFNDLQSRLARTDIAFTIGTILDATAEEFFIYLIENACLIMMLIVNVK